MGQPRTTTAALRGPRTEGPRRSSRNRVRWITAIGSLALLVTAAATAQAQSGPDTELTPQAKPPTQWAVLAGAVYGEEGEMVADSPTPYTVDFFTTSFSPDYFGNGGENGSSNPTGFFGGAECINPDTAFSDEALAGCERRPAVYRYSVDELGDVHVEPMELGGGPGFVGAIAWIDGERALAVGGTGSYPRREPDPLEADEIQPGESYEEAYARNDREAGGAGEARAWLYEDADGNGESEWTEITDEGQMQPGMGALTALDCARGTSTAAAIEPGVCLAGGLKQMWWWRPAVYDFPEGFWGPAVTEAPGAGGAQEFHFRVRQIRFNPDYHTSQVSLSHAIAVTSGCCAPPGIEDGDAKPWGARLLAFEGATAEDGVEASENLAIPFTETWVDIAEQQVDQAVESAWDANDLIPPGGPQDDLPDDIFPDDAIPDRVLPDDLVPQSVVPRGIRWRSETLPLGAEDAAASGAPLPDSYFGAVYDGGFTDAPDLFALAVPGGSTTIGATESGSRIVGHLGPGSASADPDVSDRKLDQLRLLAIDGSTSTNDPPVDSSVSKGFTGNGPDWAVGRYKGSEKGVGYTTIPAIARVPNPLTCPLELSGGQNIACDPAIENVTGYRADSKRLVEFPTYALNALSFVPGTQTAWAAGDRGSLARLGGAGSIGASDEPSAPPLRPGSPTRFGDQRFDSVEPTAREPGTVPPLATRPIDVLSEPAIEAYGTPDPTRDSTALEERVGAIAMSRDGTEGWAIGSGNPHLVGADQLVLHHFDGVRWIRCDIDDVGDSRPADEACASLEPLLNRRVAGGGIEPVGLLDIERVPLELDGDPSNDNEFATVAIGTPFGTDGKATVLNYSDGRWELDVAAADVIGGSSTPSTGLSGKGPEVEFQSPDEAWLVGVSGDYSLYHYNHGDWPNGRWEKCAGSSAVSSDPECGTNTSELGIGGARTTDVQVELSSNRVFVAGTRRTDTDSSQTASRYPFIMSKQLGAGQRWIQEYDPGCPRPSLPPNCAPTDQRARGDFYSLSVTELANGSIAGWMHGRLGSETAVSNSVGESDDKTRPALGPQHVLMHRNADSENWSFRDVPDAAERYLPFVGTSTPHPYRPELVSFAGGDGEEQSYLIPGRQTRHRTPYFPPLRYDAEEDRWRVLPAPFVSSPKESHSELATENVVTGAAPDSTGGLWLAGEQPASHGTGFEAPKHATYFYRYTDHQRRPVFEDAPHPVAEQISDLDGMSDGTVWVATESDSLYRYDRVTGWERIKIPGWDRGRVITRPSQASAIAVNDSGVGIAVGEDGRIADIAPEAVSLDPASASRCIDQPNPPTQPCGTPRNLYAAAVASDGSAIAAGDKLALTWRPAGGNFRSIDGPRTTVDARITDLSMPEPGQAWLTTATGEVWTGTANGERWHWTREVEPELAADEWGKAALNAIAIDANGLGLAVGDGGAMLERSADGAWTRLDTGFLDDFYSIALPPRGYGDGTLVGGNLGLVLSRSLDEFHVVRPSDVMDPITTGSGPLYSSRIVGLTLAGGQADGGVEAWAASRLPPRGGYNREPNVSALLHYSSDDDPRLHPTERVESLPDAPPANPGEVTLAAFGRSECHLQRYCSEFQGTNLFNEVVSRGIAGEIARRQGNSETPVAGIVTGDLASKAGRSQREKYFAGVGGVSDNLPTDPNVVHEQWRDLMADPLLESGTPVFASPGFADLSGADTCTTWQDVVDDGCDSAVGDTRNMTGAGTPTQWAQTFATMPAPWGNAAPYSSNGYTYRPLESSAPADTSSATGADAANTHYALDVVRESDDQSVARLVFADTSNARSLTASDPNQNPVEPQTTWLEEVLCTEGSPTDAAAVDCTRPPGLPAVVVTTTPTYSYGPGGIDGTQTEGAAFEEILLRNKVTALITGHLGWNGLYYTHAPGLHSPAPGGEHPDSEHPPSPPAGAAATGLLPTVVASSAGGRFGVDGADDGSAAEGFWHGYSVIRIPASGDPKDVIVEQRPILDWIGIEGQKHVLRPRQKLVLGGYGREPLGTDTSVRIDRIENEAVTHRFDLLQADPEEPWMPLTDEAAPTQADGPDPYTACGDYICLASEVGTIDEQSGEVRAGSGRHPGAYAIALLSVGQKAATYPIYFEKSPSFKAAASPTPKLELKVATPPAPPGVETPPVPSFNSPTFNAPQIPTAPLLAVPVALSSTPAQPPAPPVPPPAAPANPGPSPLDLSFAPTGLTVAPTASVIPPPAPPIQPAPPGGARKEARQRQAAAQKSGADNAEGSEAQDGAGDLAQGPESPTGSEMTRHQSNATRLEAPRREPSFSSLASGEQASAWSRGPLYGGGLILAATALALGFSTIRPRRREPEVPSPAWARRR